MAEMWTRPMWDKDGNECTLVMRRSRRYDLPVYGALYNLLVVYGVEGAGTRVTLPDVASSSLKNAKQIASRHAREANFVPKGLWVETDEPSGAWD